ncbi:MAG: stalk domain-containing protein [Clostridiales bacterium]
MAKESKKLAAWKRALWAFLLTFCCQIFIFGGQAPALAAAQNEDIRILVDGVLMASQDQPLVENGRVLIPLRAVTEYLKGKVNWYPAEQQVIGFRGTFGFDLVLGSATANLSNGKTYALDVPSRSIGGRTYVPLRFASEALGCQVSWDGLQRTVTIETTVLNPEEDIKALALPVVLQVTTDKKSGSGFFFSKDGQVITNAHIVKDAAWIKVKDSQGIEYTAELMVEDHVLDLAKLRVMKAPGTVFPVFRYMDDFSGLAAGEPVFVLGSPAGEGASLEAAAGESASLAAGVISAMEAATEDPAVRQPGEINKYRVTAAITAANSGGPMVKENGAVIGVNCFREEAGAESAYAIPIEYVFTMKNRQ